MQVKTEISYSIPFNFNRTYAQTFQTGRNLRPESCEPGEGQRLFKRNLMGCDLSVLFLFFATVEK